MSIWMYGRLNKKYMNEDTLKTLLKEYFLPKHEITSESLEHCVSYEHIDENNNVIVYFSKEEKPPQNIWDSSICGGDFEYAQTIIFDINKEEACVAMYTKLLGFFLYLKRAVDGDILVTSDVHNDICLLQEKSIIWSQDLCYDYSAHFNSTTTISG